jgi:3,4-dihydroxy 2-butanone 4-phosphate synthase/GTP cyclohydrolase II
MKLEFDSIESVVDDLRKGRMVVVVDDADRENEGDLIMAAECVTPAAINFMAKYGRGLICVPTTYERLKQLGIEQMVTQSADNFRTDFQVSVDAARGITTGISAADRARTIKVMAGPTAVPAIWCSPATSFRCGPNRAACCNGPATPRRRWIWSSWPERGPWASAAKS